MCKFKSRLLVALFTFGIGILAVFLWIFKSPSSQFSVKEIETTNKADFVEVPRPVKSYATNSENIEAQESSFNAVTIKGSFKVNAYEDNELIAKYFFDKGLLQKVISYNTQTNTQEGITKYYYNEKGEYDHSEDLTKGKGVELDELSVRQEMLDFQFQLEFLKSKNIEIPFSDMLGNEVSDLSEVLSVADNYNDFKTEIVENGNQKTIKFLGFNKNIRLNHSIISMLIHLFGTKINFTIEDYEITLNDNYPSKEIYKTNDGEVIREFFYKDGKLIKVIYKYINLENQTNSLEKRFDYHKLN